MDDVSRVDPDAPDDEPGAVDRSDPELSPAELAGQLERAFASGQLRAYYQPQYDLASGKVVALEALCRWAHPTHGILLPGRFIDVAERYGLIADVGRFMLEESGRRVADWHRRGVAVGVSLNVSPSELRPEFAEVMLARLHELGLPDRAMTVEIVESPEISYSRDEIQTLERLIAGGVGVSIDDFGVGHTSLDLVRRLPLTEVKIDRSLVHDGGAEVDALVRECIEIAYERGACVVAEGIETIEHHDRAVRWGCDRAQGYFFSPPLSVDEVEPLLVGAA